MFRTGDLSVDLVRRIVKVGERDVKLSPKEYDLLRVLVQHAGKVLTHRFLLKELWDELTDAQYSARLCPPAPPEDRSRSGTAAICADRDGDRVPAEGGGLGLCHSGARVSASPESISPHVTLRAMDSGFDASRPPGRTRPITLPCDAAPSTGASSSRCDGVRWHDACATSPPSSYHRVPSRSASVCPSGPFHSPVISRRFRNSNRAPGFWFRLGLLP